MLDFENNIDLDALFDSLSISVPQVDDSSASPKKALFSDSGVEISEVREVSTIDVDLFLFDHPADQS
jgi:hypothetical protein